MELFKVVPTNLNNHGLKEEDISFYFSPFKEFKEHLFVLTRQIAQYCIIATVRVKRPGI